MQRTRQRLPARARPSPPLPPCAVRPAHVVVPVHHGRHRGRGPTGGPHGWAARPPPPPPVRTSRRRAARPACAWHDASCRAAWHTSRACPLGPPRACLPGVNWTFFAKTFGSWVCTLLVVSGRRDLSKPSRRRPPLQARRPADPLRPAQPIPSRAQHLHRFLPSPAPSHVPCGPQVGLATAALFSCGVFAPSISANKNIYLYEASPRLSHLLQNHLSSSPHATVRSRPSRLPSLPATSP
jgi:hypothetical protein